MPYSPTALSVADAFELHREGMQFQLSLAEIGNASREALEPRVADAITLYAASIIDIASMPTPEVREPIEQFYRPQFNKALRAHSIDAIGAFACFGENPLARSKYGQPVIPDIIAATGSMMWLRTVSAAMDTRFNSSAQDSHTSRTI
jgi:hypothetical protein